MYKKRKKGKHYECKDYLFHNYEILEKSSNQIGKECGASGRTILRWLKKFDIKIRSEQTGEKHPMYGRTGDKSPVYGKHWTLTDAQKKNISGEKNSMYGRTGNKSPSWKGNDVKNLSYGTIHKRIKDIKPKPADGKCAICGKVADLKGDTKLELSSLTTHDYTLDPDDYQYIHRSCHGRYDTERRRANQRFLGFCLKEVI